MNRTTPAILRHAAAVVALTAAAGWSAAASAAPSGAPAGERHAMGESRGLVPMGGPGLTRLLDAVDASPAQRGRIEAIAQAARADLAAARDADRARRAQALALWSAPGLDADAAEDLRQQMLASVDSRSARHAQVMLEIGQVLSPAQREQWAQALQAGRDARLQPARWRTPPEAGPPAR